MIAVVMSFLLEQPFGEHDLDWGTVDYFRGALPFIPAVLAS